MALYIVKARPKNDLSDLRKELDSGEVSRLRPFGKHYNMAWITQRLIPKMDICMDRRRLLYSSISNGKRKCS